MGQFVSPEIVFSPNNLSLTTDYIKRYQFEKVLLVTDPGVTDAGHSRYISDSLITHGISHEIFDNVQPNPTVEQVMLGADLFKRAKCDSILSVGGGSPMDCAKAIGVVATNGGKIEDYEGVDKIKKPIPPLICVPTTAGSSADVSQFAIINDHARQVKMAIISRELLPNLAIIDSETLKTKDGYLSACTGIDALCHAIEAYVSNCHTSITDAFALRAIERIKKHLLPSIEHPTDSTHRNEMMLGSMEAGLAFSNACLGLVHAMSHSLGGLLDLAHGECNALLLEHVVRFNFSEAPGRYRDLTKLLNPGWHMEDDDACRDALIDSLQQFRKSVGITNTLKDCGVKRSHLDQLSELSLNDACIFTNPRKASIEDIKEIFLKAL